MSLYLRLRPVDMSILQKIVTQTKIDLKKRISERSIQSLESEWGCEKEIQSLSQAIEVRKLDLLRKSRKHLLPRASLEKILSQFP